VAICRTEVKGKRLTQNLSRKQKAVGNFQEGYSFRDGKGTRPRTRKRGDLRERKFHHDVR